MVAACTGVICVNPNSSTAASVESCSGGFAACRLFVFLFAYVCVHFCLLMCVSMLCDILSIAPIIGYGCLIAPTHRE